MADSTITIAGAGTIVAQPQPGGSAAEGLTPAAWAGRPARLARMDRLCALALCAADTALLDGKITPERVSGERAAVTLGTAYGCHATNEQYFRGLVAEEPSPRLFAYTLPSSPVGEISIHYRILGPATTLAPGLTAGVEALLDGARHLSAGRADRVLAVVADVGTPLLERVTGMQPLKDRAAAVLLERAGERVRVRLLGGDSAFSPENRAEAVRAAIEGALASAGVTAAAIDRLVATERKDDVPARAAGVTAPLCTFSDEALATGPVATAVSLFATSGHQRILVVAGDPAGRGAAAVLETRT
jgi:hypothetical protein